MKSVLDRLHENVVGGGLLPFYETRVRGRKTFPYWQEAERTQWLKPEAIQVLQWQKLTALLRHVYDTVPYYRGVFDSLSLRPDDIAAPADFARLPFLDKKIIRENSDLLKSSLYPPETLIKSGTGGSTGEPAKFYYDRNSYEKRNAIAMRGDGWAGWRNGAPEFHIWGAAILSESALMQKKKALHNTFRRRVMVSSFDLSPEKIPGIVRQYNAQRPCVVVGYANALYEFALLVEKQGLKLTPPQGVISSAEVLYDYQREKIEQVFGCKVFNRYGCREVMMIAAECDRHSGLHITSDNIYVEIVRPDGSPCAPEETGEIVLTDLHNYGMPFLRYKVGDTGSFKAGLCSCGRGLPLLNVVSGRVLDVIRTPSGKIISGAFFPHFLKDFPEIHLYQIVQTALDTVEVKASLLKPLSAENEALIKDTITKTLGPELTVLWEMGTDVTIERGRKFRPIKGLAVDAATSEPRD